MSLRGKNSPIIAQVQFRPVVSGIFPPKLHLNACGYLLILDIKEEKRHLGGKVGGLPIWQFTALTMWQLKLEADFIVVSKWPLTHAIYCVQFWGKIALAVKFMWLILLRLHERTFCSLYVLEPSSSFVASTSTTWWGVQLTRRTFWQPSSMSYSWTFCANTARRCVCAWGSQ